MSVTATLDQLEARLASALANLDRLEATMKDIVRQRNELRGTCEDAAAWLDSISRWPTFAKGEWTSLRTNAIPTLVKQLDAALANTKG